MKHRKLLIYSFLMTVIIICFLFLTNIDARGFEMVIASFIVLLSSYIVFERDLFPSLGFRKPSINVITLLFQAPLMGAGLFALYL